MNDMNSTFTTYRVVEKTRESSTITSFVLVPEQGDPVPFWPGEYLVFDIPQDNGPALRREYSISGAAAGGLRVTIKREPAAPGFGPGIGSGYFHDSVAVGTTVRAAGPFGKFRLDRASPRRPVLLSGGVGLTPLIAMAHDLNARGKPFTFIHACEDGAVHAMKDEVKSFRQDNPGVITHVCYRLPRHEDKPGRDYDSLGFLTVGTLQGLLPLDDYDFYLCGPAPFMQAVYDMLCVLGVRDERIRYEFFGAASLLRPREKDAKLPPATLTSGVVNGAPIVQFARSGLSMAWDPKANNLLEFAEEQGLMPDFSCRAGTCASCKTRVLSGEIDYLFEPFDKPERGEALICCSVPTGDITLDL